jgi:hypothetical protein
MNARSLRQTLVSVLFLYFMFAAADSQAEGKKTDRLSSSKDSTPIWDMSSPQSVYEARNWMPRASDSSRGDRLLTGKRGEVDKQAATKRRAKKKRAKKRRQRKRRMNLAQYKAWLAARIGIQRLIKPQRPAHSIAPMDLRHVGGHLGLGGGDLEGAGYSARSASEALAACSYSQYGFLVLYQGVAKGRDGFFAYKIYLR